MSISLTPMISTIFDKLLAGKITRYFNSTGFFPDRQYTYRKRLGTWGTFLDIVNDLNEILESRGEARLVQVEFSTAFDRVNQVVVIHKLRAAWIGGKIILILTEFPQCPTHSV